MKEKAIAELNKYLDLKHDWDGYGATNFNAKLIYKVINFVKSLDDKFEIIPGPCHDGSIDIIIRYKCFDKGLFLNFENDDCLISTFLSDNYREIKEFTNMTEALDWINCVK